MDLRLGVRVLNGLMVSEPLWESFYVPSSLNIRAQDMWGIGVWEEVILDESLYNEAYRVRGDSQRAKKR